MSSFDDEFVKWAQSRKWSSSKHLIAFLAVKKDVAGVLSAGHSVRAVWTLLTETKRLSMGYPTFLRYVKRELFSDSSVRSPPLRQRRTPASAPELAAFKFDSVPDKKRLLG